MKIGLYNLEPKIVNVAMMKVSTFFKLYGVDVELYKPEDEDEYDAVFVFSLFDFTPKDTVKPWMICGGTGFDIKSKLPPEIDACDYDWTLYPNCDFSIVWFSQGCIRRCPFCIVHDKEGGIHPVKPRNLNPNGKYIKVMDNNFFANPEWRAAIKQLQDWGQPVDFQGIDVRLLDYEKCMALRSLKHKHQIKIAWDNPKEDLIGKLKEILSYRYTAKNGKEKRVITIRKFMCYVLIGFNSTLEEDLYRVMTLESLKIDPFVMPYDKHDRYQKDFARWVNNKIIFRKTDWAHYDRKHSYEKDKQRRLLKKKC